MSRAVNDLAAVRMMIGPGIMQAGHEGAGPERSFGANIRLPWEQAANPIIDNDEKLIHFKYFFTRKLTFVRHSDALALFPGGFGTLDEGYEALTLMQTGKGRLVPLVRTWMAATTKKSPTPTRPTMASPQASTST